MEDRTIVVETDYKNYTFTLDENNLYIALVDEMDDADFQDAVISERVDSEYDLEAAGTIEIPVYRIKSKNKV